MAKELSKSNIVTSNTILASDVSQSIDALTGTVAYDIKVSGSLQTTGSVGIVGTLSASPGIIHQLTASNAVSSSFSSTSISSSYADNVPAGALPSGLLSSSAQIATEITGAFGAPSASFSTRVSTIEGNYATTGSNQFNGNQTITGSLIVSGSDFTATDNIILGTTGAPGGSIKRPNGQAALTFNSLGEITTSGSLTLGNNADSDLINAGGTSILKANSSNNNVTLGTSQTLKILPTQTTITGSLLVTGSGTGALMDIGGHLLIENTGAITGSGGVYITASSGQTSALLDVGGHLLIESTGAITGSGGVYITASAGQTSALLDVGGHLQIEGNGAITGSGGVYITASAGQTSALLDVGGHLMIEGSGIVDMTGAGAISGSTFSGSFVGDGSGLTGISISAANITQPFTNITASGNISGSATSTLSIGGASTLAGNNTLGTNGAGSSHTVYGNSTFTDNLQTNGVFTANGNSILGNASSDKIKIFGDSTITGSLIVSGSTTSTIDTARLRIGEYFANGGAAVSQAEELYISGSGIQRAVIESSDTSAVLQLKSPSGQATVIDFEEGGQQRWVVGVSASNDNFVISSGSSLSTGVLFQVDRTSKDVEIINNLSASAVSASTYHGDGSNLTGISSTPFPFVGDAVITGSLLISGSQAFRMDTDDVVLGTGAGALLDAGTDSFNVFVGTNAGAKATTGEDSVIIGKDAVSQATYTGTAGVYIGLEAGRSATSANYNVAIGDGAGYSLSTGDNNVYIGRYAGYGQNDKLDQVYIGYNTGRAATGAQQTLVGSYTGVGAAGTGNVAMGYNAIRGGNDSYYTANTNIVQNTAIGYQAGRYINGANNVFFGYNAGSSTSLGAANDNIIIGCNSATSLTTGDSNIIIGAGLDVSAATANHHLRIGSGSVVTISGSLATGYLHDVKADNFIISSSGTVLPTIESSDGIAALKLKSGGSHAYIDMDEGADQRWIAGMYTNDNSYRIASGSAFASNTIFELDQNGQATFAAGVAVSGSITYPAAHISTKTGTSNTLTTNEHLVLIDASGGAVTIDLPDAGTYPGREINFKVTTAPGGNTITLRRAGSDTIDGATSNTALDAQWEALSVISDGSSQWLIF